MRDQMRGEGGIDAPTEVSLSRFPMTSGKTSGRAGKVRQRRAFENESIVHNPDVIKDTSRSTKLEIYPALTTDEDKDRVPETVSRPALHK